MDQKKNDTLSFNGAEYEINKNELTAFENYIGYLVAVKKKLSMNLQRYLLLHRKLSVMCRDWLYSNRRLKEEIVDKMNDVITDTYETNISLKRVNDGVNTYLRARP